MNHQVRAVAVTKPLIEGVQTLDDFLAYTARVSNPGNQMNNETAPKLMRYLIKNAHWSPYEMGSITMEIETTRDIGRQILRHRSFSFQEFSQRYAKATTFTRREARLQDKKNRQNSIETDDQTILDYFESVQAMVIQTAETEYAKLLEMGVAKEQARAILPEGLTMSRIYMAGTIRSWIHYCALRSANGTQKEHMEIAQACWEQVCEHVPSLKDSLAEIHALGEKLLEARP